MKFSVICLVLACVATLGYGQFMKMEVVITNFEQFKLYFGKTYASPEEEAIRKANFEKNLKYVLANDGKHGVKLRINPLADLSDAEFFAMNNAAAPQGGETITPEVDEYATIPAHFDWREQTQVNPVEQQGSCGSCWAFATAFTVETQYAYRHKLHLHLSKQELVDCSSHSYDATYQNKGCEIGYPPEAYRYIMQHGLTEESAYPYNGQAHEVCYTKRLTTQHRYHINNHHRLAVGVPDATIQSVIQQYGPAVVVIHGTTDIFRHYHGGIIRNLLPNSAEVNHVVAVVGWGTENGVDYWTIRNSWGANWGENGYARIERHHSNLAFNKWCSYAILN